MTQSAPGCTPVKSSRPISQALKKQPKWKTPARLFATSYPGVEILYETSGCLNCLQPSQAFSCRGLCAWMMNFQSKREHPMPLQATPRQEIAKISCRRDFKRYIDWKIIMCTAWKNKNEKRTAVFNIGAALLLYKAPIYDGETMIRLIHSAEGVEFGSKSKEKCQEGYN